MFARRADAGGAQDAAKRFAAEREAPLFDQLFVEVMVVEAGVTRGGQMQQLLACAGRQPAVARPAAADVRKSKPNHGGHIAGRVRLTRKDGRLRFFEMGWGRIHSVVFHNSLESIPQMKPIVDLGPLPRPDDASTINATGGARRGESVFYQTGGATWRQILAVGGWDNSVIVNSPGESGVPGSQHYSDLMPLWDQGRYIPILYSRSAVEQHVSVREVLDPAE